MQNITVHLLKPGKGTTVTYHGILLSAEPEHVLIHARWEHAARDLGYVIFAPGDHFYEHYYSERWFTIFEVRSVDGALKGWYCNITRPARFEGDLIWSEDLELDLFVSPDREQTLRLDEDEFAARDFASTDPPTYTAARAALIELEQMARAGAPPFDGASSANGSPAQ